MQSVSALTTNVMVASIMRVITMAGSVTSHPSGISYL